MQLRLDQWDYLILSFLWKLDHNGVVVLHKELAIACSPDVEHASVDNVGEGTLRIVGDGLAEGGVVSSSTEEMASAAGEGDHPTVLTELVLNPAVPSEVGWEGKAVLWLEVFDYVDGDFSLI